MSHGNVMAFAKALDIDDFSAAARFVADDCVYDAPTSQRVGAEAIMASYAENAKWARGVFDSLEFKSDVEMQSSRTAVITYTDITRHGGVDHTYRCRQVVDLDADGMICGIRHDEIPGEREALEAFLKQAGVKRE